MEDCEIRIGAFAENLRFGNVASGCQRKNVYVGEACGRARIDPYVAAGFYRSAEMRFSHASLGTVR